MNLLSRLFYFSTVNKYGNSFNWITGDVFCTNIIRVGFHIFFYVILRTLISLLRKLLRQSPGPPTPLSSSVSLSRGGLTVSVSVGFKTTEPRQLRHRRNTDPRRNANKNLMTQYKNIPTPCENRVI